MRRMRRRRRRRKGEGQGAQLHRTDRRIAQPGQPRQPDRAPNKQGLPLNLTVAIKTKTDEVESKGAAFDGKRQRRLLKALLPKVDSVTDKADRPAVRLDPRRPRRLTIKGSGLQRARRRLGADQVLPQRQRS